MSDTTHQLLLHLYRARLKLHALAEDILPNDRFEDFVQKRYVHDNQIRLSKYEEIGQRESTLFHLLLDPSGSTAPTYTVSLPQKSDIPISIPDDTTNKAIQLPTELSMATPDSASESIPKVKPKAKQRRPSRKRLARTMAKSLQLETKETPTEPPSPIQATFEESPPPPEPEDVDLLDFSDLVLQESDFELPNLKPFAAEGSSAENIADRLLELDDAIDRNPKDGQLLLQRAQLFEEESNWICAISDYLKATEVLASPQAWRALERIYRSQNLEAKASNAAAQLQKFPKI